MAFKNLISLFFPRANGRWWAIPKRASPRLPPRCAALSSPLTPITASRKSPIWPRGGVWAVLGRTVASIMVSNMHTVTAFWLIVLVGALLVIVLVESK